MSASFRHALILQAVILLVLVGCSSTPGPHTGWMQTELYFAVGRLSDDPRQAGLSALPSEQEDSWQRFLDEEVTPRFPDGLTVVSGVGQWKSDRAEETPRLLTKILIILHENRPANHEKIQEIRDAFLEQTGQESVMRVQRRVAVDF